MAKPNFETQQSKCPRAEYASGDFDIRHRFTLTASYEIPGPKGFGQLLRRWKLNSIVNLQTAQRWIAFDAANNFSGSFDNADRWNYYGNPADYQSGSSSIPYCSGPGDRSVTSGISGIQSSFSPLRFRRDVAAVRVGRTRLQHARERRLLREANR